MLKGIVEVFTKEVASALRRYDNAAAVPLPSASLNASLQLLEGVFPAGEELLALSVSLMPSIFLFAHLLPLCAESNASASSLGVARDLWKRWIEGSEGEHRAVFERVRSQMSVLLCDAQALPSYVVLLYRYGEPVN